MEIEKQVCSLENSQRLKELGVVRDSLFFWELNKANKYFKGKVTFGDPSMENSWAIPFPAYTVAELLAIIQRWEGSSCCEMIVADINADQLCEFIIDLLETGCTTKDEVNED